MFSFDQLLYPKRCSCGDVHSTLTREIHIRSCLLNQIPERMQNYPFKSPVVICDENTLKVAGQRIAELLGCALVTLPARGLHATEKAVELAAEALAPLSKTDCLIAAGSGTIHDITRYLAHSMDLEFISVPTAASVDGFVSTVAAMTWHGVKKTLPARAPIAVFADLDVISAAPFRLTAAGLGDMVGKYTALADWRIAHLLTGEPLCETIYALEEEAVKRTVNASGRLKRRDPEGVQTLMEGLLLSGVAMQMTKNSRPASGSEHHISHFIEMLFEGDTPRYLHGEKVGAATIALSKIYHGYADNPAPLSALSLPSHPELAAAYGNLADGIEAENRDNSSLLVNPDRYQQLLPEILRIVNQIPSPEELKDLLTGLGCPVDLADLGMPKEDEARLMRYIPYARCRLTMLRILADFGLLQPN